MTDLDELRVPVEDAYDVAVVVQLAWARMCEAPMARNLTLIVATDGGPGAMAYATVQMRADDGVFYNKPVTPEMLAGSDPVDVAYVLLGVMAEKLSAAQGLAAMPSPVGMQ